MKRKILAMLLAAVLALSLLAACGSETDTPPAATPAPATPTPDSTPADDGPPINTDFDYTHGLPDGVVTVDPITLTAFQWELDNQTTDFQNLWYYERLKAETNVTVNFTAIKESEWNEQMNLMFASGDYPDLIIRPNQNLNIEDFGVSQGILIPLDGYIEANMPNYAPRLALNDVMASMRASDGHMYYIGYLVAQNINHDNHFFMNKTWLDAVGKDVPKTIDELTDVLKAFRDQAPGAPGMIPFSAGGGIEHHIEGIYTYFGMFGVPLQRWVYASIDDNFNAYFPGYMNEFREAVEWLNMCWDEGLLDKESLTQDENNWNTKINSDQVGFANYLRLINSAWANPDTIENWVSIIPPSGGSGAKVPRTLEIPEFGAVLTRANDYIPQTLRWLDAQMETVSMLESVNGPIEGGPFDPLPLVRNADGKYEAPAESLPPDNGLYTAVPVTQGQFFAPGDYYFDVFVLPPHRIERRDYAAAYNAAGVLEKNSFTILQRLVKPTADEATERARMFTAIETFMKEKIADFIMNGVTDASWAAFLDEAKAVGVDDYIALNQKLLDEYLAAQ